MIAVPLERSYWVEEPTLLAGVYAGDQGCRLGQLAGDALGGAFRSVRRCRRKQWISYRPATTITSSNPSSSW